MSSNSKALLNFDVLLAPIPGKDPVGQDVREVSCAKFAKLKVARKELESQERGLIKEVKSDWRMVASLARDVLIETSKDLEIANWLTHALIRTFGFRGLRDGLELALRLEETYGDRLHPQDEEIHAARIAWLVQKPMLNALRTTPLVHGSQGEEYSWQDWNQAKELAMVADPKKKKQARDEKKVFLEDFDKVADATPQGFFDEAGADLDASLETLRRLSRLADERFPDEDISLRELEVTGTGCLDFVNTRRRIPEPEQKATDVDGFMEVETPTADDVPIPSSSAKETVVRGDATIEESAKSDALDSSASPKASAVLPKSGTAEGAVADSPESSDAANKKDIPNKRPGEIRTQSVDEGGIQETRAAPQIKLEERRQGVEGALDRIAEFVRDGTTKTSLPYQLIRSARWAELRASAEGERARLYAAPTSEQRRSLRALHKEAKWPELLEATLCSMSGFEGRGWLDLQFYVFEAAKNLGGELEALCPLVLADTRRMLEDFPSLTEAELEDGTRCASSITQAWLNREGIIPPQEPPEASADAALEPAATELPGVATDEADAAQTPEVIPAEPTVLEKALERLQRTDVEGGLTLLRDALQGAPSPRDRFLRQLDLAEYCLQGGRPDLSRPLLDDLVNTTEQRQLEGWEPSDVLARIWTAVLRCHQSGNGKTPEETKSESRAFEKLCNIDITRAWVATATGPAQST